MSEEEYYSGGGEKTIVKSVILEKYLNAYLDIMKKHWDGQKWYVGTHAGTGFTTEMGVDLPGSALRALRTDFDRFYFYELDDGRFDTLVETLNSETSADLSIGKRERDDGSKFRTASSQHPYIRIMNMDCNEGVKWLIENSRSNNHWFTFVDPEQFSVERDLMERLCERGNMDILFNFQTTGFYRNAGNEASHSHEKVASNLGENFPRNGTEDDLVEWYEDDVFRRMDWKSEARTMVSEGSNNWRYDLIFASKKDVALKIIGDIYDGDLKNDVQAEVQDWREKTGNPQKGLTSFDVYDPEAGDDDQSGLSDFC